MENNPNVEESTNNAVETKKKEYGKNAFKKWGSKGGQARNESDRKHLTFKDSDKASEAGKRGAAIRWAKYRQRKLEEQIVQKDGSKE